MLNILENENIDIEILKKFHDIESNEYLGFMKELKAMNDSIRTVSTCQICLTMGINMKLT